MREKKHAEPHKGYRITKIQMETNEENVLKELRDSGNQMIGFSASIPVRMALNTNPAQLGLA